MKPFKIIALAFTLSSFFAIPNTKAAGIEVSPSKLEITIRENEPTEVQINVANPTADVQVFEIYADDFSEQFVFSPASFTLESGARKTIKIEITKTSDTDAKILSTTISIVGKPLAESRFQAATGVKIPVTINLEASSQKSLPWPQFAIGALLVGIIVWQYLSSRKKPLVPET